MLVVHLVSLPILVVHKSTLVVLFTQGIHLVPFLVHFIGRLSRPRFSIGSVYTQFYRYPESEKAKYRQLLTYSSFTVPTSHLVVHRNPEFSGSRILR